MKKLIVLLCIFLMGCSNKDLVELDTKIEDLTTRALYLEDENRELKVQILELEEALKASDAQLMNQKIFDDELTNHLEEIDTEFFRMQTIKDQIKTLEDHILFFSSYNIINGTLESYDENELTIRDDFDQLLVFDIKNYAYIRDGNQFVDFNPINIGDRFSFHVIENIVRYAEVIE